MSTLSRFRTSAALDPPPPSQPRRLSGSPQTSSPSLPDPTNGEQQSRSSGSPEPEHSDNRSNSSLSVRRRRRSSSTSESDATLVKRLRSHVATVSNEYNLPPGGLDCFVEVRVSFPTLSCLSISLQQDTRSLMLTLIAMMLAHTQQLQTSKIVGQLASIGFKNDLGDRLMAAMTSPNLTAYVTDTSEHIIVRVTIWTRIH